MPMTATSPTSGSCACGAVRFTAQGEPNRVGLCHCFDCRKHTGAPFGAFAIYPSAQVTVTGDEPGVFASSTTGRRYFCRSCGPPLFCRDEGSDDIDLLIGAFDATSLFAPTYELWTSRREDWLPEMPCIRHGYSENRTDALPTET